MKRLKTLLAFCSIFVLVTISFAQEKVDVENLKESIKQSVKKDILNDVKNYLGLSLYVQASYTYNFENYQSQSNDLRVFDNKSNSFLIDLAQIIFAKDAEKGSVGYKIKASMGQTAKYIHSAGLGAAGEHFDLTEAYIDYIFDKGNGIKLRAGKFATFIGAEVIEAIDNPNFSRSLLFNYAIPFTHTGLMISYPLTDKLSTSLYLVNGWDNTEDNNKSKSFGLSFGYTPSEIFSLTTNLMYGPEQNNNNSDNRFLVDLISTIKPTKKLSFIINADYGNEKGIDPNGKDADWKGIAGIVKYDFNDTFGLALRGEYFKDTDGVRTGISQEVKEITVTPELRLSSGLIIRPEYRHDWSTKKAFNYVKGIPTGKSQDTVAISFMYRW
ncbi:MAG: porin [Proteobacteria bacterium]|nr:porin [Pseudomonadota bacterium]